jgi:hypothetical protein
MLSSLVEQAASLLFPQTFMLSGEQAGRRLYI